MKINNFFYIQGKYTYLYLLLYLLLKRYTNLLKKWEKVDLRGSRSPQYIPYALNYYNNAMTY